MHRTPGADPQFTPATYGEIWVRVFDTEDDSADEEPTWRHFHVSPQEAREISVAEAVSNVEVLNEGERRHAHRFQYYAVEVHVTRSVATDPTKV